MKRVAILLALGLATLTGLAAGDGLSQGRSCTRDDSLDWRTLLKQRISAFGHRNWIVVADAAYPVHSSPGIETVVTGADQLTVLKAVLDELGHSTHVRPRVILDAELPYVPEKDAPGVEKYRADLRDLLEDRPRPQSVDHEEILSLLDSSASAFKVLILKTSLTIPYTSVFLQLDCGYWSREADDRMRAAMPKKQ